MEMEQEVYESDAEEKGVLCETWDRLRRSLRIAFVILIIIGIMMDAIAIACYTFIPNNFSSAFIGLGILFLCIPVVGICCTCGIITFSRICRSADRPCHVRRESEDIYNVAEDFYNVPFRKNEKYRSQRASSYDTKNIRDVEASEYNSYARTDSLDYAVGYRPDTAVYQLESNSEDSEEEYTQCSNVRGYECQRNTQRKYPHNVGKLHVMGKSSTLDVRGLEKSEYYSRSRREEENERDQSMQQSKSIQPYKNRPRSKSYTRDYKSKANNEIGDMFLSTRKVSQTLSRSNEEIESSMKDVEVTECERRENRKLSHMLRWQSDPNFSRRYKCMVKNKNEETPLNKLRNMKNKHEISQCRETVDEYSTPNSKVITSPMNSERINFPINGIYSNWSYERRQQLASPPPSSTERDRFRRLSNFRTTTMNYSSANCKNNREYSSTSRENIQNILSERGGINTSGIKVTALLPRSRQGMRFPSPDISGTRMILSGPTMENVRHPLKNSTFRKSFAPINKSIELHTSQSPKKVMDYSSFTNKDSAECLYRRDTESAHLLTSRAMRTPCDLNAGLKPHEYLRVNNVKIAENSSSSVRTKQTNKSTSEDSKVAYPSNLRNGQPYIWIQRDQL